MSAALELHRRPLMRPLCEQDSQDAHSIEAMRRDGPQRQAVILSACGRYPSIEKPAGINPASLNFDAGFETGR